MEELKQDKIRDIYYVTGFITGIIIGGIMRELKQWINCLIGKHEWKEEGTGKDNKIVCFCKYCGKIITVEKKINERAKRASETNGSPYLESINWSTGEHSYFIPYYKLVRQYEGETVANNLATAKDIQASNTMEGLIKEYHWNEKYAKQQAKKEKKRNVYLIPIVNCSGYRYATEQEIKELKQTKDKTI